MDIFLFLDCCGMAVSGRLRFSICRIVATQSGRSASLKTRSLPGAGFLFASIISLYFSGRKLGGGWFGVFFHTLLSASLYFHCKRNDHIPVAGSKDRCSALKCQWESLWFLGLWSIFFFVAGKRKSPSAWYHCLRISSSVGNVNSDLV